MRIFNDEGLVPSFALGLDLRIITPALFGERICTPRFPTATSHIFGNDLHVCRDLGITSACLEKGGMPPSVYHSRRFEERICTRHLTSTSHTDLYVGHDLHTTRLAY